ncbi:glycerol-3-phosphate cytidylyltransferase [Sulfitobacter sp. LCG007]
MRRTVLTYGSFDMFGPAEALFLRRLCGMGTELIVGCATDAFAAARGTPCRIDFAQRRATLEACRFVSRVIPEMSWDQKRTDIVNYDVAVFAMSGAWAGTFDHLGDLVEVVYIAPDAGATRAQARGALARVSGTN